jgi:RNA polymerase subunit RPABC4/transcription elongation factor Spt4
MEEITARGIQVLIALAGAYLVALWFVLIVWAYRDSEARSRSVVTQVFSTLLVVLFYFPGLLLYLILRPKETLDVAFQRSLEEEYLLQDLEELPHCPSCHRYVEDDYRLCPHCQTQLRESCVSCGRLVALKWSLCPYCGGVQGGRDTKPSIKIAETPERFIAASTEQRPTVSAGEIPNTESLPYPDLRPALEEPAQEPQPIRAITAESDSPPIRPFDRRYTRAAAAHRQQDQNSAQSDTNRANLEVVQLDEAGASKDGAKTNGRFGRGKTTANGESDAVEKTIVQGGAPSLKEEETSDLEASTPTYSSGKQ